MCEQVVGIAGAIAEASDLLVPLLFLSSHLVPDMPAHENADYALKFCFHFNDHDDRIALTKRSYLVSTMII